MLEAAGGDASAGGTWARVVHRVLEEADCAALIASVNTKGTHDDVHNVDGAVAVECADRRIVNLICY